jgi:acetolactate synthase small subunit
LTIEVTGDESKIESLLTLLQGFGIRELARTGKIAMTRGLVSQLQIEKEVPGTRGKKKKE